MPNRDQPSDDHKKPDLHAALASSVLARTTAERVGGIAAATRLLTADGYRPIGTLRRGDMVRTVLAREATLVPIQWIGCRTTLLPRTGNVGHPVRIRKWAVADGVPERDVILASDHAIYVQGKLYRAGDLVNGQSILLERQPRSVLYYGVVLKLHNILLAENLPVESLLPANATAFAADSCQAS